MIIPGSDSYSAQPEGSPPLLARAFPSTQPYLDLLNKYISPQGQNPVGYLANQAIDGAQSLPAHLQQLFSSQGFPYMPKMNAIGAGMGAALEPLRMSEDPSQGSLAAFTGLGEFGDALEKAPQALNLNFDPLKEPLEMLQADLGIRGYEIHPQDLAEAQKNGPEALFGGPISLIDKRTGQENISTLMHQPGQGTVLSLNAHPDGPEGLPGFKSAWSKTNEGSPVIPGQSQIGKAPSGIGPGDIQDAKDQAQQDFQALKGPLNPGDARIGIPDEAAPPEVQSKPLQGSPELAPWLKQNNQVPGTPGQAPPEQGSVQSGINEPSWIQPPDSPLRKGSLAPKGTPPEIGIAQQLRAGLSEEDLSSWSYEEAQDHLGVSDRNRSGGNSEFDNARVNDWAAKIRKAYRNLHNLPNGYGEGPFGDELKEGQE